MKRRLPTINQGRILLVAPAAHRRHEPPHAHRRPSRQRQRRLPRRPDRIQRPALDIHRRCQHLTAQLDSQRRERHRQTLSGRRETPATIPEPSCKGPPHRQPPVAPPPARPRPARSPHRRTPPPPAGRPARTPAATHGLPHSSRTGPGAPISANSGPPPGHHANSPTRNPAAANTTLRNRTGQYGPQPGFDRRRGELAEALVVQQVFAADEGLVLEGGNARTPAVLDL